MLKLFKTIKGQKNLFKNVGKSASKMKFNNAIKIFPKKTFFNTKMLITNKIFNQPFHSTSFVSDNGDKPIETKDSLKNLKNKIDVQLTSNKNISIAIGAICGTLLACWGYLSHEPDAQDVERVLLGMIGGGIFGLLFRSYWYEIMIATALCTIAWICVKITHFLKR